MGKQTVTHTPGAASELPELSACVRCGYVIRTDFVRDMHMKKRTYCACACGAKDSFISLRFNGTQRAEIGATPAPVTEGARREAVAWRVRRTYENGGYTDWLFVLESEAKAHAKYGDTITPLYTTPPHPDRVQPERVEAVALELAPLEPKPACWIDGADIGHLADGAVEHVYAYAKQILPCMVPVFAAPPNDASGEVTDAMVQAAAEAYLGHKNGPHSRVPRDAMRAALEAADRARKPGYRQPTIEDAREIYLKWDSLFYTCDARPLDECLRDALQHIGAVIPEASREPGQPWDGEGAVKQPEPPRDGQQAQPE